MPRLLWVCAASGRIVQSHVVAADSLGMSAELVQSQAAIGMRIGVSGLERQRTRQRRPARLPTARSASQSHPLKCQAPARLGLRSKACRESRLAWTKSPRLVGSECAGQRIRRLALMQMRDGGEGFTSVWLMQSAGSVNMASTTSQFVRPGQPTNPQTPAPPADASPPDRPSPAKSRVCCRSRNAHRRNERRKPFRDAAVGQSHR